MYFRRRHRRRHISQKTRLCYWYNRLHLFRQLSMEAYFQPLYSQRRHHQHFLFLTRQIGYLRRHSRHHFQSQRAGLLLFLNLHNRRLLLWQKMQNLLSLD